MTVKETLDVVGLPTTAGAPVLRNNVAVRNATAVQRLFEAGAVIFGKTNVPLWAADFETDNEIYGMTHNAWDQNCLSGGSSGGSAVGLAAGLTPLELGSDIGGSIRNPSHYNNTFGHRPTWGIVSGLGHVPGPPGSLVIDDLGTVGPMARSPRDLRMELNVIAGTDPVFGAWYRAPLPEQRSLTLRDLRVALWLDDPVVPVDRTVLDVLWGAVAKLEQAGLVHAVQDKPDYDARQAFALYNRLLWGVIGGSLDEQAREALRAIRTGAGDADWSQRTHNARGATATHAEWLRDDQSRQELRVKWAQFFQHYDVLIAPIMCTAAHAHDASDFPNRIIMVNGRAQRAEEQLFWASHATLCYLPATSCPAGFTQQGLPVGMQIIAPYLQDYRAIAVATAFSEVLEAHLRHPPIAC